MEWKHYKMDDVIDEISMGPFGSDVKKEFYVNKGIPILNGSNLQGFKLQENSFGYLTEEKADSLNKCNAHRGDIIVTHRGTLGQIVYVPSDSKYDRYVISQSQFRFRCKPDLVDVQYLVYYFHTREGQYKILANASQVGVPALARATSTFRLIDIKLPSLADQRRIASILSSLDRKIELNNKINADLEEMAQAIFKNWFIDFEPFKDGKFVDSELGMIPEGWKVGSYSEMIESLISGDWGKETPQGNYTHEVACVRGCDFQDINNGVRGKTPQRYILEKNYQAKHLKDKDILVEISGGTATVSTGRTSLVTEELLKKYKHDIVCTNFCKVLRPLSQFSSYVYYSWKYKYDNDIMFGYENGTSGIKNFAIKDFIEKEPVLIPKEQDIVEFQQIIDNLQKQKQIKGTENTTLSLLRDTLLPRLMSGEIEVPE